MLKTPRVLFVAAALICTFFITSTVFAQEVEQDVSQEQIYNAFKDYIRKPCAFERRRYEILEKIADTSNDDTDMFLMFLQISRRHEAFFAYNDYIICRALEASSRK